MRFFNGERKPSAAAVPLIGRVVLIHRGIDNRDELAATTRRTTTRTRTRTTVAAAIAVMVVVTAVVAATALREEGEVEKEKGAE